MAILKGKCFSKKWWRLIFEHDTIGCYIIPLLGYSNQKGFKRVWFGWLFWLGSFELSNGKSRKEYLCDNIAGQ